MILRVARQMLDEGTLDEFTLNTLARRVGLAKSNVYRYFESREAILLEVFRADFTDWADELVARLRRVRSTRRVERLVALVAETYASRGRMCQLMSIMPSVIEHNVSVETLRETTGQMVEQGRRLAADMHALVPELPLEAHFELIRYSYVLLVGLWPIAHPPPIVEQLDEDPRFAVIPQRSFEADLAHGVGLVIEGMLRQLEQGSGS